MKISNDSMSPSLMPEKNETQSRASKKPVIEKHAPAVHPADEVVLTGKTAPATTQMREVEIANAAAVEFDVSEVPMIKMKLAELNNYILNNTAEALSAQANLSADTVAGLIS